MGMTILEQVARRSFARAMTSEPEMYPVLSQHWESLASDPLRRVFHDDPYLMHDPVAWHKVVQCYDIVRSGRVGVFSLDVGEGPSRDDQPTAINRILATLPAPFSALFQGGTQDADGYFVWNRPTGFARVVEYQSWATEIVTLPARGVPLEVGYTRAWKSFSQLMQGGLARWPYGSSRIYVFAAEKPQSWIDTQ